MDIPTQGQRGPRSRWVRILAVALGAALLIPVPVLALTFLAPWTVVTALTFHTPNVPQPHLVGFTDTGKGGHVRSTVIVNMGTAVQPGAGFSQITVQRPFQVTSANGEMLALQGMVNSIFADASFSVTSTVGRLQGSTFVPLQNVNLTSGSVGSAPTLVHRKGQKTLHRLRRGTYVVRLTFFYAKGPTGFWQDLSPQPMSPNRFESVRS